MNFQNFYIKRLGIAFLLLFSVVTASFAVSGEKFSLVKSISEINSGDVVMIVRLKGEKDDGDYVLSKTLGSKNNTIKAMPITVENGVATATDDAELFRVDKSGNSYMLYSLAKGLYLCNDKTNKDANNIAYRANDDNVFRYTSAISISFGTDNIVHLQYAKKDKYLVSALCFSNSSSGKYFNCYADSFWSDEGRCVRLFKRVTGSVALNEASDNSAVISKYAGTVANVSLARKLVGNKWNTFCVPFDISMTDGKLNGVEAVVMEYAETIGNVMMFTQANIIKAGTAYLIKPSEDITNPVFSGVKLTDVSPVLSGNESGYGYIGVYSPKTFDAAESKKSLIVNGNDENPFLRPAANSMMRGMRAYFITPHADATDAVQLKIGGMPTAISEIVSDVSAPAVKVGVYMLDGSKVGALGQCGDGVYIVNGKKVIYRSK